MISTGPHSSFHSSIFRHRHSPSLQDPPSFTQLPPIHNLLPPQIHSDVVQRPRGSTLPSYPPAANRHAASPSNDSSFNVRKRRISSLSRHILGDSYSDQDDEHNASPMPPGISLPPIRVESDASAMSSFNGLPPIKTMLPSPSRIRSLDHSRSPASPKSTQSIAQLSSSWSSNVHTSGSSGDITGRFHREYRTLQPNKFSPSIDGHYNHTVSLSRRSPSPPPVHVEDDSSSYRNTRRATTVSEVVDTTPSFRRQNLPKPSRSSLLSHTAPRPARNALSEIHHPPLSYPTPRSGEDVIMAPASSASGSSYPTSVPGAASGSRQSARRDSHEDVKLGQSLDYTTPQYHYMSPGQEGVAGSFESSENEAGRLKPGETAGGKKRRSRATQEQLDMLNGVYQRTPFPTTVERNELAHRLGMTPRSVQIWFQNKRQGAKHNESRRRELPPLASARPGSPPMPNMIPLTLTPTSPPSPVSSVFEARSMSYGAETRREALDPTGDLRGRARRRRMSVNDLLRQDARDEVRPGVGSSRFIARLRPEEQES